MTSNCPPESIPGGIISSLFSSGTEVLPGLAVYTLHPAAMAQSCVSLIDLDELEGSFPAEQGHRPAADILSPAEKERFAAFTYPKRRREWLGGRLACKMSILDLLRLPPGAELFGAISILPAEHGAPRATGSPALPDAMPFVSISHSGRYAVAMAAISRICGVDIQQVTAKTIGVADRFAEPGELHLLRKAMPDWNEVRRLTLLWAAKEALKKSLLADQPVFFRGIILQAVSRRHGLLLRFSHPADPGDSVEATALSLDGYMLAYSIPHTPHA